MQEISVWGIQGTDSQDFRTRKFGLKQMLLSRPKGEREAGMEQKKKSIVIESTSEFDAFYSLHEVTC